MEKTHRISIFRKATIGLVSPQVKVALCFLWVYKIQGDRHDKIHYSSFIPASALADASHMGRRLRRQKASPRCRIGPRGSCRAHQRFQTARHRPAPQTKVKGAFLLKIPLKYNTIAKVCRCSSGSRAFPWLSYSPH